MTIRFHRGDLPQDYEPGAAIAVDTETLGLNPFRDRLCVVQLSKGDGTADIVQIVKDGGRPDNLVRLLADRSVLKIFHFARFDLAVLEEYLGVMPEPVYCTKIASKLTRNYTDKHGLKDLVRELLNITLQKEQQSSDWGADVLTQAQLDYAAADVLYLHALKEKFDVLLAR
jgi:ribonuclease D